MLFLYIYITLHLLALLFPPVRKGWRRHFEGCVMLLGREMYQTVCEPIDSDKPLWWQYAVYAVVYLLAILYAVFLCIHTDKASRKSFGGSCEQ